MYRGDDVASLLTAMVFQIVLLKGALADIVNVLMLCLRSPKHDSVYEDVMFESGK